MSGPTRQTPQHSQLLQLRQRSRPADTPTPTCGAATELEFNSRHDELELNSSQLILFIQIQFGNRNIWDKLPWSNAAITHLLFTNLTSDAAIKIKYNVIFFIQNCNI